MDNVDEFIEKWQKIESLIKKVSKGTDFTKFHWELDVVVKKDSLIERERGVIEDMYALRNVYSHRDRKRYIAMIEDHVLSDVGRIYKMLQHPSTVNDIFGCDVYTACTNDNILDVMEEMSKHTYTHTPIINDGVVTGVFAYNSFFDWAHDVLSQKIDATFEKRRIGDINKKFLNQPTVRYEFIADDEPAGKILTIFKERMSDIVRLDCIIITKTGKKDSEITGIITAWDLYKVW